MKQTLPGTVFEESWNNIVELSNTLSYSYIFFFFLLNKAALKLIRHCPTKHLVQKICYELFNLGLTAKYSVQEKL